MFVHAKPFQPNRKFVARPGASLRVHHLHFKGDPALLEYIKLGWKGLPITNTPSY